MKGRSFISVILYKRSACNTDGYLIHILCSRQDVERLGVDAPSTHPGKESKTGTVL